MGTSRWMEHELEVERARILRLPASKQEQLIMELETDQLTEKMSYTGSMSFNHS